MSLSAGGFVGSPDAVLSHLLQTSRGTRADAGETAIFTRQLESVKAEVIDYEYPAFRALEYIPLEGGVDPFADTFVYYEFERTGLAKMIESYADDLPLVDEYGTKVIVPIRTEGIAWHYDVIEVEKATKANYKLEARRGLLAREAIERLSEHILARGDAARGIKGFANNASVPLLTQGSSPEIRGAWATATADHVLDDLHLIAEQVWVQSKQLHRADSMLLGTNAYKAIATRPYSTTIPDTILSVFLKSSPSIRSVNSWVELDLADAQADGERAIVYEKNPMNMGAIFPLRYRSLPPEARNLAYYVNGFARIGGCVVYRPLSMIYVDGMNDAHT